MRIRLFFWMIGVLGFASLVFFFARSPLPDHPRNVILISIDTLRADHLGLYGYERDTSPNLDAFAKEAVVFEQAIAQSSWTLASHVSLLTSQYPSAHGIVDRDNVIYPSKETLPEIMKKNGYRTAAFVGGGDMSEVFGYGQGFDMYDDHAENDGFPWRTSSFIRTFSSALSWLKDRGDKPFFLFVHGYDVHDPYRSPGPFERAMKSFEYDGPLKDYSLSSVIQEDPKAVITKIYKKEGSAFIVEDDGSEIPLAQEDFAYVQDKYDAGILYTDALLERFFSDLKRMGLYEDAIIIVMSDHGETLGDALSREGSEGDRLIGHGLLYDEITRVALLMKHPDIPPGRVETQVQLIDLMPTLADSLGLLVPERAKAQMQGVSLMPLLEGRAEEGFNEYAFSEERRDQSKFVRSRRWKLVHEKEAYLLYDLQEDPRETRNVADEHPDVTAEMKERLFAWYLENLRRALEQEP